jgi:hypothetical protein
MSQAEEFIKKNTKDCSNQYDFPEYFENGIKRLKEYQPWLTPDEARKVVEIASEEMIEKACEYLDGLIEIFNDRGHQLKKERIIGGLKQAMEDENTD